MKDVGTVSTLTTTAMAAPDRAYSILLSQLHKPSPALSLESLQGLISHCLSQTSTPTAATPLTATIISSPLFRPFSHPKLAALSTGFRHAAHLRLSVLKKEPQSIWSRGVSHALQDWTKAVIKGFAGGQGILRLVAAGGLLLALDDLGRELTNDPGHSRVRRRAEEEVVIAVAEVMDVYASLPGDGWEQEFHPDTERGEGSFHLPLFEGLFFTSLQSMLCRLPLSLPLSLSHWSPKSG